MFHKRYLTPNGIEECRPDSDSVNVTKIIEIAKNVGIYTNLISFLRNPKSSNILIWTLFKIFPLLSCYLRHFSRTGNIAGICQNSQLLDCTVVGNCWQAPPLLNRFKKFASRVQDISQKERILCRLFTYLFKFLWVLSLEFSHHITNLEPSDT